ncbi:MAG TPA: hypothetical protein VGB94_10370 [Acidobacteriaceae bacterium]
MHRLSSSFILAYHGCKKTVAEKLLAGDPFTPSDNDYDWLGPGIYFWEANPKRALEWAKEMRNRKRDFEGEPCVVGAVIDMGYCLDLISSNGITAVKAAHRNLEEFVRQTSSPMPENTGGDDRLQRRLDCAVIKRLHTIRDKAGRDPFDTIRGVFIEGNEIYPGAGFREKTHIQICVCNQEVIKAVFRVPDKDLS